MLVGRNCCEVADEVGTEAIAQTLTIASHHTGMDSWIEVKTEEADVT